VFFFLCLSAFILLMAKVSSFVPLSVSLLPLCPKMRLFSIQTQFFYFWGVYALSSLFCLAKSIAYFFRWRQQKIFKTFGYMKVPVYFCNQ